MLGYIIMVIAYYTGALALSFICFMILWTIGHKQSISSILMAFTCVIINNAAYLALAMAKNTEEALLANRFIYLASVFLPLFLLTTICQLLRIRIGHRKMLILTAINFAMLFCTWSTGYTDWYYKSASIDTSGGFTLLVKEYGTLHWLYILFLIGYAAAMLTIMIVALFRQQRCSYKYSSVLIASVIVTYASYFLQRLTDLSIDLTVYIYLIVEIVVLLIFRRIVMYDVSKMVSDNLEQSENSGYVIFNRKKQFMGCNMAAKRFLPELKSLLIDHTIPEENEYLYDNIGLNLRDESRYVFYLKRDVREFKISISPAYSENKSEWTGYVVEIADDTGQRDYIHLLDNYNDELSRSVKEQTAHIRKMQDKLILGMADMVEGRDKSTGGHIRRTSEVIGIFTEYLRRGNSGIKLSDEFLDNVIKAAPMHDLGKIAIDDEILRKPGKFTLDEFEIMKTHAAKGAEIIRKILDGAESDEFSEIAVNIAHYHHEKWNGKGYPDNLSGEAIPVEARIMALADVFDALVSKRCYKEAMSFERAFGIIEESLGEHFDPVLGREFIKCRPMLEEYYGEILKSCDTV
ncbi:MAG: HD domain-containing protein [Oscillospiraceae bacterium]|nr:HD domain-containing protein [Oscillospiraceae bacterium]